MTAAPAETDHDQFLRTILERPDDDGARLVYADWLDEHAGHGPECGTCGGEGKYDVYEHGHERRKPKSTQCANCHGTGRVSNGYAERAAYIRWGVGSPQNSAVCLYLNERRQPQPCETCRLMGGEVAGIPRRADGETHYVINRGFIAEVRLTCEAFVGGPCGRVATEAERRQGGPCPTCSGTGRTPGLAAALFAAHPIERVVLTDREPVLSRYDWSWFGESAHLTADPGRLPDELWQLLPCVDFPTRDAALAALSAACVAYGRKLAGLEKLV